MKRIISAIIALFLILSLGLVVYGSTTPKESTPSPTLENKISAEVTPSPTSAGDSLAGERMSEEVMSSPTPTEEKIVIEVTPSPTPVGDAAAGQKVFASGCKICHRKYTIHTDFIASKTDQELFEFIKIGGLPNQPLVMQPKGGKPSLTDEKLYDIIAYLRSLQE